jgi:hypothetical protein
MAETEVYEYSLSYDQSEYILKMSLVQKNVCLRIENQNGQRFIAFVSLPNLKKVSKAFNSAKTLNELLIILHNTIEAGNISLTPDEEGNSIDIIFTIKLASGNYPPFAIKLDLDNENYEDSLKENNENNENNTDTLPARFDYRGNVEAEKKYGTSTENTTEYDKPIVQPNVKKPILQLEYIEPILQVHYPDGKVVSKQLPPRIQTVDGQIPNINEAQFKLIQEEMNKHMANQETSKYSLQTVPVKNSLNFLLDKEDNNDSENQVKSKYSTFTVPAKPIVYPEQKYINNNSQNNHYNTIEYAPNIFNQDKKNNEYTYSQPTTVDYNNLINQNNSYNYSNYNYSNDINNYEYQNGYTKDSYDINQLFSQNQYQYDNYQYQNNYYTSYPQTFQQFEHAFAEVIPLNPINEYLQSQMQSQPKQEEQIQKNDERQENVQAGNNQEEKEAIEDNTGNEEEVGKEKEQVQEQDIEEVFRTEEGLIIFRNGILQGIIQKYGEIDNVVSRIQDIISKGAKFTLLYKATRDGDKASTFHEKCDNHPMTLVLVETTKGVRFGGFTRKSWEGRCLKKTDNDAFVFSIDKNKIYDIVLNEPAVGAYPKFGPVFFGCQIRIYNECFTKGGSTCYRGLNYKTTKDFELNNGEQTYIVKDIEVYDIEAIDV